MSIAVRTRTGSGRKVGAKVRPSYRASATGAATATSVSVTIPAAAQVGDYALFTLVAPYGRTVTPPAGVSFVGVTARPDSGCPDIHVYELRLQAGHPGANMSFGISGAGTNIVLGVSVYANTSGLSVGPHYNVQNYEPTRPNKRLHVVPSAIRSNDLCVAVIASYFAQGLPGEGAVTTKPADWTIRTERESLALGVAPRTLTILDSSDPASNFMVSRAIHATTNGTPQQYTSMILSLAPVDAGCFERDRPPPSLTGVPVHCYGSSYMGLSRTPNEHVTEQPETFNSVMPYYNRVRMALGDLPSGNQLSLSGSSALDQCNFAFGSDAMPTRGDASPDRVGTWYAYAEHTGLVLMDPYVNDVRLCDTAAQGGSMAKSLSASRESLLSLVHLVRSQSLREHTHGSVATSGSWSTVSSDAYSGGSAISSTSPGSTVTITTTEENVTLCIIARDDDFLGGPGSPYEVSVNGSVVATGTTANKARRTGWLVDFNYGFCQMSIPLTNLGTGSKTITLTHTGESGQTLTFDCYLIPSPTPPVVIVSGVPVWSDDINNDPAWTITQAQIDSYDALVQEVCDAFPDGRVIPYFPRQSGTFDVSKAYGSDKYHLSDWGNAHYATEIMRLMNETVA